MLGPGIAVSAVGLLICILWVAAVGSAAQQVEQNELTPVDSVQAPVAGEHSAVFTLSAEKAVNVRYGELGAEQSAVVQAGGSWEQAFTFGGGSHFLSLSATAVDSDDYTSPITCSISVDGTSVAEQSNPFGVMCSATVEN